MKENNKSVKIPKRGEIWLTDFNRKNEEEESKIRPVLIISDNIQNECDRWIVVVPMTTKNVENILPVEIFVKNTPETGIDYPSKLQFNYPRTIDKELRLIKCLGVVNREMTEKSKTAWNIAFDTETW
jgi:mRNA interferase MazF